MFLIAEQYYHIAVETATWQNRVILIVKAKKAKLFVWLHNIDGIYDYCQNNRCSV